MTRANIQFTQSDTALLQLTAQNGNGVPQDLTGADFTSSFLGLDGAVISFGNSQHTANPDQVLHRGQFTLSLSAADTNSIPAGINKELLTLVVQGGQQIYYRGPNLVTVFTKVPRQ